MFRTFFFWSGLIVVTAFLGSLTIATAPFDRRGRIIQRYSRLWARANLWLAGVRARLAAAEPLPADRAHVFVANHQSAVDIFALGALLPGQYRWVAKRELFRIPILGRAMLRAGYVPIDREDPRRSRSGLSLAAAVLAAGDSLVVFPEGTRSADGRLRPFKRGAFALAQAAGSPVVPVAVIGGRDVLAPGSYRLRPGTIRVEVAPAIPSAGLSQAELAAQARAAIAERLDGPGAARTPSAVGSPCEGPPCEGPPGAADASREPGTERAPGVPGEPEPDPPPRGEEPATRGTRG